MRFIWRDYDPETMGYIESWLDADTVRYTGLDDGFRDFYEYWAKEDGYVVGENFWSKVFFEKDTPFAVIAFGLYEGKVTIMEIVVAPEKRGQGYGAKLLKELLEHDEIMGFSIPKSEAVIFPENKASQSAFEKAGFYCHHIYEDGSAMLYTYEK